MLLKMQKMGILTSPLIRNKLSGQAKKRNNGAQTLGGPSLVFHITKFSIVFSIQITLLAKKVQNALNAYLSQENFFWSLYLAVCLKTLLKISELGLLRNGFTKRMRC